MSRSIPGIHHITAIAGHPQANLDFYAGFLGLRLVKLTVNFDDPGTYHLYYGDGAGSPGTILTFFPWPNGRKGRCGSGQVTVIAFSIPGGAIEFWSNRLARNNIAFNGPFDRFGEQVLRFFDPDGTALELVSGAPVHPDRAYAQGPVPLDRAIHGFHSATLSEEGFRATAGLLTEVFGFTPVAEAGSRFRYAAPSGESAAIVDVVCSPGGAPGGTGVGTVHHIAWRTADDDQQREWLQELTALRYNVTPVMDRKYFHSIYFREPGQVLFEIATDPPGFAVDEPVEEFGTRLLLPPWLEPERGRIEAVLPPLRLPAPPR